MLVDLLLAPAQPGQILVSVPRCSDAGSGPLCFVPRRLGFLVEVRDGVGETVKVALKAGDEVQRGAAAKVVGEEPDIDVGDGDGDADLVLDAGDRLGMDCETAERKTTRPMANHTTSANSAIAATRRVMAHPPRPRHDHHDRPARTSARWRSRSSRAWARTGSDWGAGCRRDGCGAR